MYRVYNTNVSVTRAIRDCTVLLMVALAYAAPAAQRTTTAAIARAGWEALNAGRLAEAASLFEEGLKAAPKDERLLLGSAVTAHLQGRSDAARGTLVDALAVNPAVTAASLLLGEILYRSGDIDGAIAIYQQALAYAPREKAQLTRRLEGWRKESMLHSRFVQRYGNHFTVLFEGPEDSELADRVIAVLESAYWRVGSALSAYPTDVVTVVLYTREQFRDITSSPDWAGGSYDGRIRVPIKGAEQNPRELERVLAHEFTHALIRSLAPRGVPVWLDEGLAVQFEGSSAAAQQQQVRDAAVRLPLARLERSFGGLSTPEAALAYAESAAAVQMIVDEAGSAAIVNLLVDVGSGTSFADAFERQMLVSYAAFQQRFDQTR